MEIFSYFPQSDQGGVSSFTQVFLVRGCGLSVVRDLDPPDGSAPHLPAVTNHDFVIFGSRCGSWYA